MRSAAGRLSATDQVGLSDLEAIADAVQRSRSQIRVVGCALAALAAFFFFDVENRAAIVVILLVTSLHALLDAVFLSSEGASNREAFLDILLVSILGLLEPSFWLPGVVALQGTLSYQAVRLTPRALAPLASITIVMSVYVGVVIQGPWLYTLFAMPVATLTAARFGADFRAALHRAHDELEATLAAAGAIAHLSDVETGSVMHLVGDVKKVTGWEADGWLATDHTDLVHPEDYGRFWIDKAEIEDGRQYERVGRFKRPDGTYWWLRDISRAELDGDGKARLRGLSFDVTRLEEANERVRHQARHDQLTGLQNRLVLNEMLEHQLARGPHDFALLSLDLNRFKEINDTLGHHFGDDVLCVQAQRLEQAVRPEDLVVRLGGDEFAVVVHDAANDEAATEVAQRIAKTLARPITVRDLTVVAAASIGIVRSSPDVDSAETLLRHADIAMYEAKNTRTPFRLFTQELDVVSAGDVTLGAELVGALNAGEILLHFQPQVDLTTGEIVGAEGLARWEHPTRGLLVPSNFLHLLDVSEAHRRFTDQMIEQAIECARRCNDDGHPVPIAVNASVRTLQDPDFADRVLAMLGAKGVPPHLLMIELTEQDLQDQDGSVLEMLARLSESGVEFSIDDFGTGFSSMERLRDLPVHELKIDRTFVQRAPESTKDRVIAGTIIDLAGRLGHKVVGEGVETEEQAEILRSLGCGAAQGYLYGSARPRDEFVADLSRSTVHR